MRLSLLAILAAVVAVVSASPIALPANNVEAAELVVRADATRAPLSKRSPGRRELLEQKASRTVVADDLSNAERFKRGLPPKAPGKRYDSTISAPHRRRS